MKIFLQCVTLLLLATWLPATQHCTLESLDALAHTCTSGEHPNHDHGDIWDSIEKGALNLANNHPGISAPSELSGLCALCLAAIRVAACVCMDAPDGNLAAETGNERCHLPWIFVQRAAPSPRAPAHCMV